MVKKSTKKKIAIGTAIAVAGGAAAMANPKTRKSIRKLGHKSMDKVRDIKDDLQDKF